MAEALILSHDLSKDDTYRELLPQIESLISGEPDLIANLANIAAALAQAFGHLWTGFYIRRGDRLVLGPFQGPIACTSIPLIPIARGVCGAAAAQKTTLIVADVEKFAGHIACSSAAKSEIVVPLVANGETALVLDIDSHDLNTFDDVDATWLEQIIDLLRAQHFADSGGRHDR